MQFMEDLDLFILIKQGDKSALSELFLRYYDDLKHYGFQVSKENLLVEEVIQELFIYIFESHHRLGEIKYVKPYLYRSLRRRIIEKLNKERKRKIISLDLINPTDIKFSNEDILFQEKGQTYLNDILADMLNQLPWRQREAIYLRYYNGLTTREIAAVMGVANQTILNTLYQALKKIRKNKQINKLVDF